MLAPTASRSCRISARYIPIISQKSWAAYRIGVGSTRRYFFDFSRDSKQRRWATSAARSSGKNWKAVSLMRFRQTTEMWKKVPFEIEREKSWRFFARACNYRRFEPDKKDRFFVRRREETKDESSILYSLVEKALLGLIKFAEKIFFTAKKKKI